MIDLHLHSTASDGSVAPGELISLARREGVGFAALTDHDTVAGVEEFLAAATEAPEVEAIGGIEVSCVHQGVYTHILGYGVEKASDSMLRTLEEFRVARDQRCVDIVERLRELGVDLDLDEVMAESGGESVGRPHIAAVMVRKGVVADVSAAFREYLATGKKAYVERKKPLGVEAVEFLRSEKLVPVLAHPPTLHMPAENLAGFVKELVDVGLRGIECYYPGYSESDAGRCLTLAKRHGLLRTGGSDFHGDSKPNIRVGKGDGTLRVPEAAGDRLREAIAEARRAS